MDSPPISNLVTVGNGISALAAINEFCKNPLLHSKQNPIINYSDGGLYQSSSSAAYAIVGGKGVFSTVKPRSRFRFLLQLATRNYKSWLLSNAPNVPLKNIHEVHVFNKKEANSLTLLNSLRKMILEEQGNTSVAQHSLPKLPALIQNGISNIFKNEKSCKDVTLAGHSFTDCFYINTAQLIHALQEKAKQKLVMFRHCHNVHSFTKNNEEITLKILLGKRIEQVKTKHVLFATGHRSGNLMSHSKLKLATTSTWNEWVGFCGHDLPPRITSLLKNLHKSMLIQFANYSLLLISDAKKDEMALQLTSKSKKNFWNGTCGYKSNKLNEESRGSEENDKDVNKWLKKNPTSFNALEALWEKLFFCTMPSPSFYGSGYRTRSKDWLPTIGLTPPLSPSLSSSKKNRPYNAKAILIGNFYKSGITMAPLTAEICKSLLNIPSAEASATTPNSNNFPHASSTQHATTHYTSTASRLQKSTMFSHFSEKEITNTIELLSPNRGKTVSPYSFDVDAASSINTGDASLHYPYAIPTH